MQSSVYLPFIFGRYIGQESITYLGPLVTAKHRVDCFHQFSTTAIVDTAGVYSCVSNSFFCRQLARLVNIREPFHIILKMIASHVIIT
jgi:hypothetical protein